MLTKKVGNIIIIMIVGLPFRLLEKEDKRSSDIVMTNIQAFVWKLKKGITVTSVDGRLRAYVCCSSLSLFTVGPGFKETPVSPLCINL